MSAWRTRFYMKCRKCGYKTPIYTQQELCCAKCGEGYDITCYNCGQVFRPEASEMCSVCHWWICPECNACSPYCASGKKMVLEVETNLSVDQWVKLMEKARKEVKDPGKYIRYSPK